ncbi:thioredoxin C-1 [Folsomia candida]|uniref:Putative thioredoxin-2 n=1 Tax=Folsomia candida TaxID=158441 RepID=A0A226EHZ3_FOLCA|nr:thioredoxin C-1 [Folsomia candida]OXA56858.1 putative thioredoxin-2 [Folsomia candida]
MNKFSSHSFLQICVVFLLVSVQLETFAKTANLIDIYRPEVFEIAVLKNRKPVIVYYSKGSCTLCARLQMKLEKMAKENSESFYLARVDLDALPELQEAYGIKSIPTTRAFYKGRMIEEVKGLKWISMSELADKVLRI